MYIPIRRVGVPSAKGPLPEAQYQDEFYRSLFSTTAGNVRISPEFASAKGAHAIGRIDFLIPTVRWGIEIIRDGIGLKELNSRFEPSGAYGAWVQSGDMTDYILLDCCTKVPQTAHPSTISDFWEYIPALTTLVDIPNLFHVVFSNKYEEVTWYDNKVKQVWGSMALLENHF